MDQEAGLSAIYTSPTVNYNQLRRVNGREIMSGGHPQGPPQIDSDQPTVRLTATDWGHSPAINWSSQGDLREMRCSCCCCRSPIGDKMYSILDTDSSWLIIEYNLDADDTVRCPCMMLGTDGLTPWRLPPDGVVCESQCQWWPWCIAATCTTQRQTTVVRGMNWASDVTRTASCTQHGFIYTKWYTVPVNKTNTPRQYVVALLWIDTWGFNGHDHFHQQAIRTRS